ncbi:hypothetical protein CYMTET_44567 [Cymbomonas tetramitiformis]|uniref:RING-CH-type domain-containing protein n=1 Tax=Cymbomonas tetramitiformis TaxID=36881 RepID=A0AAE0C175_9CHLO|nr:hypothetical protein CYMTET_44567 [Cymbomonas tetramitiformis]
MHDQVTEDEDVCRFCFEGRDEGDLVSPCDCAGGNKYVHLSCLRRWQRMVLVNQPTHPAFYEDDVRHHKCNVCLAAFTCPPPTRHELMESFTGPEIGSLIDEGCIIGSHDVFSEELTRQLEEMPVMMRGMSSYEHWIDGAYLITGVTEDTLDDDKPFSLPLTDQNALDALRERLQGSGEDLGITVNGRRLRIVPGGSLAGVNPREVASALRDLKAPATLCMAEPEKNSGDDHVTAVNLSRVVSLDSVPKPLLVTSAVEAVRRKYPGADQVEISHFKGGPCDERNIVSCLVPGGARAGWTVVPDIQEAVQLAHSRAVRRCEAQGNFGGGQTVRLTGLQARKDLNGQVGLAVKFAEASGRWTVRMQDGEGKQVRPVNLEAAENGGPNGRVMVFWGDARWSRTQLLGEIARGHWGLCRASVGDIAADSKKRHANLAGRLAFAPVTEMTESFMKEAQRQMTVFRSTGLVASTGAGADEGDDD